jgi:hypothetical protein
MKKERDFVAPSKKLIEYGPLNQQIAGERDSGHPYIIIPLTSVHDFSSLASASM